MRKTIKKATKKCGNKYYINFSIKLINAITKSKTLRNLCENYKETIRKLYKYLYKLLNPNYSLTFILNFNTW